MNNDKKQLINAYTDASVTTIDPMQAILKKPSLYLGNLHTPLHTLEEAILNSVDEGVLGVANRITITLHEDNTLSVEDNGRGIPPYYSDKFKQPTVRQLLTVPHSGKGLAGSTTGSSQHGLGMKATVATSLFTEVTVWRDGYSFKDRYELINSVAAVPVVKLDKNGELPKEKLTEDKHGTRITWLPNPDVFDSQAINEKELIEFCSSIAFLTPGIEYTIINKKKKKTKTIVEKGGIKSLLEQSIEGKKLTPFFSLKGQYESEGKLLEASVEFLWSDNPTPKTLLFTNNVPNPDGGTAVSGLYSGITKLINDYAKELKLSKDTLLQRDVVTGLVAVINLKHPAPTFVGQTKKELLSADAKPGLHSIITTEAPVLLDRQLSSVVQLIKTIIQRVKEKNSELKLDNKTKDNKALVSKKLSPARKTGPGKGAELFIVEGDSAGGLLVDYRDTNYQAVLPLKGKFSNVKKTSAAKLNEDTEVKSIIAAIGTGILSEYNPDKRQFDRVIIATDADPDGGSITCLILTLFLEFCPELLKQGFVYRAITPLYVNKLKGNKKHYSYSEEEQTAFLKKNKKSVVSVTRNKGLGQLSGEMLQETLLDSNTRRLVRLELTDEELDSTEELVEAFMGKETALRRNAFFSLDFSEFD